MRGAFDEEDVYERVRPSRYTGQPAAPSHDTELTLGIGSVLLLLLGLVVLCGACFGVGYVVGHRRAQPQTAAADQPAAGSDQTAALTTTAQAKPSASSQPAAAPAPASAPQPDAAADSGSGDQPPAAATVSSVTGQSVTPAAASPQVRPALPPQTYSAAGGLMVQVASLSHEEDADVLVGALRKRGYAVSVRRDAADNLIHVRVGPFSTRDEANRWRQKLLNDGYNAVVQ